MAGMAASISIGLASIISHSLTASRYTAAWAIPTLKTASLRYGRRGDGAGGTCATDGRRGIGTAFADGAVFGRVGFGHGRVGRIPPTPIKGSRIKRSWADHC